MVHQSGPLRGGKVRSDEVELGVLPVEGSVTEQENEKHGLLVHARRELPDGTPHALA